MYINIGNSYAMMGLTYVIALVFFGVFGGICCVRVVIVNIVSALSE